MRRISSCVFILLIIFSILAIAGCSEDGCGGCDEEEQCDCVPDDTNDAETTYHYSCTGGSDCGCSCDEDDSKDGESCNPA